MVSRARSRPSYCARVATLHLVPDDIARRYEVREWRNACAVLKEADPSEWTETWEALRRFTLLRSDIETRGGAKSPIAIRLDEYLTGHGWQGRKFATQIVVDGQG